MDLDGRKRLQVLAGKTSSGGSPWPRTWANSKVPKEGKRPGQGREEEGVP